MSDTTKRLYKSRTDRSVSGVCGGLADYFNVDSTLVRVLFVLFTLMGGPGLIVYIVLALVMPEEPQEEAYYSKRKREEF